MAAATAAPGAFLWASGLPGSLRRVVQQALRYWTQRAAIASELPPPTGLYDGAVWTRMHAVFDEAVAAGAARPEHADDG